MKKALTAERHAKWDEINYLITDSSISGEDLDKLKNRVEVVHEQKWKAPA